MESFLQETKRKFQMKRTGKKKKEAQAANV